MIESINGIVNDILNAYLPESIIIIFILFSLTASLFFNTSLYKLSKWFTLFGITLALGSTFFLPIDPDNMEIFAFNGEIVSSIYTIFFKILILMSAFFLTLLSRNLIREKRDRAFEYFTVFLCAVLFAMCTVSVTNFAGLFFAFEGLGLCSFLLLNFSKKTDAKQLSFGYFVQGNAAAFLFLFGISYLYGLCGQISFSGVSDYLAQTDSIVLLTFAFILILCVFLFKLGIVPFSSWVADTFEGAGYPIAAFMSTIPVLAGFGILSRLLLVFMNYLPVLKILFICIAMLTILFSALSAIRQTTVKRLMAYSMSVQSGIMLLGLGVFSVFSLSGVLFYLLCYMFVNIGVWAAIILFYDSCKRDNIEDYNGLIFHRPYYVIAFSTVLIALAGLAPTSGFVAKLYLFSAVARAGFLFLPFLIISMLACVIMIFAYWKLIRSMFRRVDTEVSIDTKIVSSKFILYACALASILLCIFADKIIQLCQSAAYYL